MASSPDLSLPEYLPGAIQHQARTQRPFALYTLTPLPPGQLDRLRIACHEEADEVDDDPENCIKVPPQSDFSGAALRDIVMYHLALADQDQNFDATRLLVCVDPDWADRGVLVVTLNDDAHEGHPDKFFVRAADAGLMLMNLQIGNETWSDAKESSDLGK